MSLAADHLFVLGANFIWPSTACPSVRPHISPSPRLVRHLSAYLPVCPVYVSICLFACVCVPVLSVFCVYVCLCVSRLSICLSIFMPVHICASPSNFLSTFLFVHLSVCKCIYPAVCPSFWLSIYLFVRLSVCPPIYPYVTIVLSAPPSVCSSICLSIYLSVIPSICVCVPVHLAVCSYLYLFIYSQVCLFICWSGSAEHLCAHIRACMFLVTQRGIL